MIRIWQKGCKFVADSSRRSRKVAPFSFEKLFQEKSEKFLDVSFYFPIFASGIKSVCHADRK